MTTKAEIYHVPVLLKDSVDGLNCQPDGVYVDVTFGGGGHSSEILRRLGDDGQLFGLDQDADAERNIIGDDRFTFIRTNFRYLKNWMRYMGVEQIDGLLADLGVSSHHFDDAERGFSFRFDAPLDMRMNKRAGATAAEVVNTYSEEQLADILYYYGELRNARQIASALVKSRMQQPISTTTQLMQVTERFERFGLPIHFTENTFVSGQLMPPEIVDLNDYKVDSWPSTPEGEARQAENLMTMMSYLFSRPLVEGFTTWDFEDHQWLGAPSGLIRADGSPKPALLALQEKLRGEWHTSEDLMTDENGCCRLHGYRGEYELEVDGQKLDLSLTRETKEQRISTKA